MLNADRERNRDRLKASIGVAAFHALLGYALITGLGFEVVRAVSDNLKTFDVQEPLPPPLEEQPKPDRASPEEEGAAAPPNLKSEATPVVAPPPKIRLEVPPPVVSAPLPTPRPGNDPTAGAPAVKGPARAAAAQGPAPVAAGAAAGRRNWSAAACATRIIPEALCAPGSREASPSASRCRPTGG
jgi:protein TonB